MLNNEYLGLIRMAEDHGGYDMKYEVDIHYDTSGSDNVKIMEAYGCSGIRVADPSEIRTSLEWARKEADRTSRPVLVEIMIEREGNTANGTSIAAMKEFEPLP
jgi:tartronate-semialdehyde synthase